MQKLTDVCDLVGISVAGIIDKDYSGNTTHICDVPVIDSEDSFNDPEKLKHYKENFNFFCAVNWSPERDPINIRNKNKRTELLKIIEQLDLPAISLVDPTARVSISSIVGKGVFLDLYTVIEPKCVIGDFTNIYTGGFVGHHSIIEPNCVFQRHSILTANSKVGRDSYFAMSVKALKPGAHYGVNTFIQEGIYIRRGTVDNEIVSQHAGNRSRVVGWYQLDQKNF